MSEPETVDFGAVACRDKGLDMIIANERHDRGELILSQKRLDFDMLFSAVTALNLIQRASAHERFYNVLAYAFRFVRNDTYTFALIKRGGEIIDGKAVDPGTDDTNNDHTEVIDKERSTADHDTTDRDRSTDIEMEEFIEDLTDDIESAGRCIDAEEESLTCGEKEDEADEIEPNVSHAESTAHDAIAHTLHHFACSAKEIGVAVGIKDRLSCLQLGHDIRCVDGLVGKEIIRIDTIQHFGERT